LLIVAALYCRMLGGLVVNQFQNTVGYFFIRIHFIRCESTPNPVSDLFLIGNRRAQTEFKQLKASPFAYLVPIRLFVGRGQLHEVVYERVEVALAGLLAGSLRLALVGVEKGLKFADQPSHAHPSHHAPHILLNITPLGLGGRGQQLEELKVPFKVGVVVFDDVALSGLEICVHRIQPTSPLAFVRHLKHRFVDCKADAN